MRTIDTFEAIDLVEDDGEGQDDDDANALGTARLLLPRAEAFFRSPRHA